MDIRSELWCCGADPIAQPVSASPLVHQTSAVLWPRANPLPPLSAPRTRVSDRSMPARHRGGASPSKRVSTGISCQLNWTQSDKFLIAIARSHFSPLVLSRCFVLWQPAVGGVESLVPLGSGAQAPLLPPAAHQSSWKSTSRFVGIPTRDHLSWERGSSLGHLMLCEHH